MSRSNDPQPRRLASRVMLRIALIISVVEVVIMLLIAVSGIDRLPLSVPVIDAILLVMISTPLIYFWVLMPFVVERERQLEETRYLAQHDELTKLCNRRMFYNHLEHCLPALARHERVGALIYFDLDGFKPVNDEHGHEMGDRVLAEIGSRLTAAVRGDDVIARIGGDEFALLMTSAGLNAHDARQQAEEVAKRLQQLISEPMSFSGRLVQVGCSVGAHLLTADTEGARQAMKVADMAMYRSKRQSSQIVFSDAVGKDSYEIIKIGVAEIDKEHAEIDRYLGQLMRGNTHYAEGLAGFVEVVEYHFRSEAEVSHRLGLNMTPEHLYEHQRLLAALKAMADNSHSSDWVDHLTHIGELLERHVLDYDRQLREVA